MGRRISALTAQKRNPERINIYLEDKFAFGLSRFVAAWLFVGQELSDEKIAELQSEDIREVAYQRALNFLSYRDRSEAEVRKHLYSKGLQGEVVEEVLERLRRAGLLDDDRFAHNWVENRSQFRPRSRRALVYELKQKGISETAIHAAVDDVDEEEMAYLAAQKKAMRYIHMEWSEFSRKMYTYLAGKGFNYQVSAPVIARLWRELSSNIDGTLESASEEVDL
jgi:regulatory protein